MALIIVCCLCFISCKLLWHSLGEVIAKAVPRVGDDKATKAIFKHLIEQGEQGCNSRERAGSSMQRGHSHSSLWVSRVQ